MIIDWIKKVYLERKVANSKEAKRILEKLKGIQAEVVEGVETIKEELRFSADPVGEGKQILYLAEQKSFIRPCPCTPGCVGCGYWTIDLDLNCPLDCSYCILQRYLEGQPLTIALNRDDFKRELEAFFSQKKGKFLRIGTGELADSLALDALTENSVYLAEVFRGKPEFLLELKTKTSLLESLLGIEPVPNIILAWSLNPPAIIQSEEKRTAPLEERLRAAVKAVASGYRVAFHFDPIVHYPGWQSDYQKVIDTLLKSVPSEAIAWISLGTLRFHPNLLTIARRRFPLSPIYDHEFVISWDGKFRYPRPLRLKIYEDFIDWLAEYKAENKVYFCMESTQIWKAFLKKIKRGKRVSAFPFPWQT